MSFDVFLQCYGGLERQGLPRERVRALFPIAEEESEPERWVVRYDSANQSDIFAGPDDKALVHMSVSRPAGDLRLWDALLSILRMGPVVMYWPGSPPIIAGSNSERVPRGIVEALGEPVVVERPEEFLELLKVT
jgi:hypothetical protein